MLRPTRVPQKANRFPRMPGLFAALAVFLLSACVSAPAGTEIPSALDPRGFAARNIATIWWIQFALGLLVLIVVTALIVYLLFIRRQGETGLPGDQTLLDDPKNNRWIWIGGIIVPAVILAVVMVLTLSSMNALASPSQEPETVIEVIGHQWWWEVRYSDEEFVTANEIHVPAGQPVRLLLTSADVIHSFWVPQLHGKMDLNPGKTNSIWIEVDEPGVLRGLCAEFCGIQHAKMQLLVIAQEPEEFDAWIEQQRQPAPEPNTERIRYGQQLFLGSSCVYCHTVRGTNANATVGPDLTHLASRRTLGSGILDNTRGNLAGWIVDPQHIKPGNLMPPTSFSGDEVQALLDYLETLD